jgi:hypothetical protein
MAMRIQNPESRSQKKEVVSALHERQAGGKSHNPEDNCASAKCHKKRQVVPFWRINGSL